MITYLDPAQVIAKRQTAMSPRQQTVSGYGGQLKTSWLLQLTDKRWRRVYVMQFSNSGSAYVKVKGQCLFLGSYDPRD